MSILASVCAICTQCARSARSWPLRHESGPPIDDVERLKTSGGKSRTACMNPTQKPGSSPCLWLLWLRSAILSRKFAILDQLANGSERPALLLSGAHCAGAPSQNPTSFCCFVCRPRSLQQCGATWPSCCCCWLLHTRVMRVPAQACATDCPP